MAIEMTVTVRTECQWCGGTGKRETLAGTKDEVCGECHGECVSERQMGLRDFRRLIEIDAMKAADEGQS